MTARLCVEALHLGTTGPLCSLALNEFLNSINRHLPKRAGKHVIDHCITSFNHVRLPKSALLGELDDSPAKTFAKCTARITIGSLCLSLLSIPVLSVSAYISGCYSLRRTVVNPAGSQVPIWSFKTQQAPILHGLAQVAVSRAYSDEAFGNVERLMVEGPTASPMLSIIAVASKAASLQRSKVHLAAMTERCGSQGLFDDNVLISLQVRRSTHRIVLSSYLINNASTI